MDNNLIKEEDEYICKYRLVELFEDLDSVVTYRLPEKLNEFSIQFIIQRFELKNEQGLKSDIFTKDEERNIF